MSGREYDDWAEDIRLAELEKEQIEYMAEIRTRYRYRQVRRLLENILVFFVAFVLVKWGWFQVHSFWHWMALHGREMMR